MSTEPAPIFGLFIEPMRSAFGSPRGADRAKFAVLLADALDGFTPRQLEEGAKWFREHRKRSGHPTIAECRTICEAVSRKPPDPLGMGETRPWETDRQLAERERARERARVIAVARIKGDELADVARAERWLPGLIEHVVMWGQMPDGRECDRIRRVSEQANAAALGDGPLNLRGLRDAMHEAAEAEVFGPKPKAAVVEPPLFSDVERAEAEAKLDELRALPLPKLGPGIRKSLGMSDNPPRGDA